jgi:hypothetical protein
MRSQLMMLMSGPSAGVHQAPTIILLVKVVLKGYQIRRASASAHMLCPFPEYSPLFQNTIRIVSEGPDDYRMISGYRDK